MEEERCSEMREQGKNQRAKRCISISEERRSNKLSKEEKKNYVREEGSK